MCFYHKTEWRETGNPSPQDGVALLYVLFGQVFHYFSPDWYNVKNKVIFSKLLAAWTSVFFWKLEMTLS